MKKLSWLMGCTLLSVVLVQCKKDDSGASDSDEMQMVRLNTSAESENDLATNDVFDNAMGVNTDVGVGGTGVFGRMAAPGQQKEMGVDTVPSCVVVTSTRLNPPALFPLKVVIDFGSGCTGNDGHTRSGKIIINYTGRLIIPGNSATTTFDNYHIDSIKVTGTHTTTNTTAAGSNQRRWTVNFNGKLTKPSGNYVEWQGEKIITQVEGNATESPIDDVFTITGHGHGVTHNGNLIVAYQSLITEALRKRFTCPWIVKGVLSISRETLPSSSPWNATINYGQGNCDYDAVLTVNGSSQNIQLPH